MEHFMKTLSHVNERGVALVISLMFLALLSMLGTTAIIMTTTDMQIGRNYRQSADAFYNADAGVNFAFNKIKAGYQAGSFSLPSNPGETATLSYTTPSGFSFSISDVTKITDDAYSFTSTGTGPDNAETVIKVVFSLASGVFNYGIFGDLGVSLSGNAYTDSYDSSHGVYTWATRNTEGDVGTNAVTAGAISLSGNAKIYGDASIGPGGDPATGVTTHGHAMVVAPGQEMAADEAKDMTPHPTASPVGATPMSPWTISGNNTDDPGYSGIYQCASGGISISGNGNGIISGDATFYLSGNVSISGNGELKILAGVSLTLYVSGSVTITGNGKLKLETSGSSESSVTIFASGPVSIAGNGISNFSYKPERLQIYGTSTCNSFSISGNGDIYGAIYVPAANVSISGNGDIYGAIIGSAITMSGNGHVHYDEALQSVGPTTDLKLVSWQCGP